MTSRLYVTNNNKNKNKSIKNDGKSINVEETKRKSLFCCDKNQLFIFRFILKY